MGFGAGLIREALSLAADGIQLPRSAAPPTAVLVVPALIPLIPRSAQSSMLHPASQFERKEREAETGCSGEFAPSLSGTGTNPRGNMLRYRIFGIPDAVSQTARDTLRSPQYGHPAHVETATGYGPCRQCLRPFREGEEERILFTYQPFSSPALPAPGPVFIHREPCERFDDFSFPEELRPIPLVLESYGEAGTLLDQQRRGERRIEDMLEEALVDRRVKYLHLRNAEAGCFIARIEPVSAGD